MHVGTIPCLQFCEQLSQLRQRFALQAVAQPLILWHRRQLITFQHGLNIESCTTTENGFLTSLADVLIHIVEILLILKQVILRTRLPNIYQMKRYLMTVHYIVG